MIDENRWAYQIDRIGPIKDDRLNDKKIDGLNKKESGEYMDLSHHREVELIKEPAKTNAVRKPIYRYQAP